MTESEFLEIADAVLERIEAAFDDDAFDVDLARQGGVLEITFDDGAKIIVNQHLPNRELWIAARSGGFHYREENGMWRNTRDGGEFFGQLGELVRAHAGQTPHF
jgi:CyaY protein